MTLTCAPAWTALSRASRKPQLLISIVCGLPVAQLGESERHRRVIRTRLSAQLANFVSEAAMAAATDSIGVRAVVRGVQDEHVITVNIHSRRTRPAPGADHDVPTLYCSHMH